MSATPQDLAKMDALISNRQQAPERIHGWLNTQMSVARHWGGLTYMGHSYYVAPTEPGSPLVRDDVLKREAKAAKEEKRMAKIASAGAQGALL